MLPAAKLGLLHGEAPSFNAPPVTHLEPKGQGSEPLSQVSTKRTGGSVSHTSSGACVVIVSLSPIASVEATRGR